MGPVKVKCVRCKLLARELRDWKEANRHLNETIRILAERVKLPPPSPDDVLPPVSKRRRKLSPQAY